jgi:galactoside O-acetyltransferase
VGFASYGENLKISSKASFYNPQNIRLGSNVRIDDFCVLSAGDGGITIQNNVHIAVFTSLIGGGSIHISDFCNLSSRVSVYSSTDDFSGDYMTSPVIPSHFTNVIKQDVFLAKHVVVGCGSVILPGVELNLGVAVGALSLVKTSCEPFTVYAGIPARKVGSRSNRLLDLERDFLLGP